MHSARQERQRLKLLKRLNSAGAAGMAEDAIPAAIAAELCSAISDGQVSRSSAGWARLTNEGQAALKRALHPQEEFAFQHRHHEIAAPAPSAKGEPSGPPPRFEPVARRNLNESVLDRLSVSRGNAGSPWLTPIEREAGERLRADFEKAQLQPRITANWETNVATAGRRHEAVRDLSDFAIDARKRVEQAMEAMGPELAGVALDLCCFLKGLETVERERQWPQRSAKLMLRAALRLLVRHYGLETGRGGRQIRQWGAGGYRPEINGE